MTRNIKKVQNQRAWFSNKTVFHGSIPYPDPHQGGDDTEAGMGYVDWGYKAEDKDGNSWRQIGIINETHDWSYSEDVHLKALLPVMNQKRIHI